MQEIQLVGGMKFNVTLPPGSVRIVSFNVEPRSVPLGHACKAGWKKRTRSKKWYAEMEKLGH
jgi:hypothetical protein